MNKRIDFTNLGGIPITQESFDWMQQSYRTAFAAFANMIGNKVILYGCTINNGAVSNGWVSINGELMPFVGAAYQAGDEVIVVETAGAAVTFQDNSQHEVYFEKYATIGGPNGFPFTDLKPLNLGVPVGTVLMWSGNVNAIPAGFLLCDGTNGTPNLKGMFIAGYDPADADYNAIGKTGGEKKHQLTIAEMPAHHFDYLKPKLFSNSDTPGNSDYVASETGQTKTLGNNQPHENRPPYYTLAFIIKQ